MDENANVPRVLIERDHGVTKKFQASQGSCGLWCGIIGPFGFPQSECIMPIWTRRSSRYPIVAREEQNIVGPAGTDCGLLHLVVRCSLGGSTAHKSQHDDALWCQADLAVSRLPRFRKDSDTLCLGHRQNYDGTRPRERCGIA